MIRRLLEGVTYGMRDTLEIMRQMDIPITQVRASGGGARSEFWHCLQADIYKQPIVVTNAVEGPAYGVALLAGVGTACGARSKKPVRSQSNRRGESRPSLLPLSFIRHYAVYGKLNVDL